MGDRRRHIEFAALIARNFPNREARIADVAGGKGHLRAELFRLGYRNVETWDKCRASQRRTHRSGYRHALFNHVTAPEYDLVVGMHPDGGTDHIVLYGARRRVPFVLCPCCVIPSAHPYGGPTGPKTWRGDNDEWTRHLLRLAGVMDKFVTALPITGRNQVIVARPTRFQKANG